MNIIANGRLFVSVWQALIDSCIPLQQPRVRESLPKTRVLKSVTVKVLSVSRLDPDSVHRLVAELDARLKARWPVNTGVLRLFRPGRPFCPVLRAGGRYEICVTSSVEGVTRAELLEVVGLEWEPVKIDPSHN